jgi:HK97 family phage major capsid protein
VLRSLELKRERQALVNRLEALNAGAAAAGRDHLLASEQEQWDRGDARLRELDDAILRAQELEADERSSARPITGLGGSMLEGPAGWTDRDPEILGASDSVREWAERHGLVKAEEPTFGRFLQAALGVGALREAVGPEGGFLTPVGVSAEILDLARARAVLTQAGALVRPIEVVEQKYPRLSQDPTASWVAERATIPESTMAFEAIAHHPYKLATIVKISQELLEDADGLDAFVRAALADAFALEIDKAGLRGDGVGKPQGIRDWSGISLVSMGTNGATPTSYGHLVDAITAIRGANLEPAALIAAPRTFGTYGKLADTQGQPLRPPDDVARLRKFSTTSIPTNLVQGTSSDTSEAFVGEFSNYVFSVRVAFELQVLKERFADTGEIGLLPRVRIDGSPVRDAAFAVVTGIRAV